ncbi:MAG: HPr kinase/phosphorylase [Chlamydiae bacterium]|nr:HPr kinase/phosphorylase [Chlamydiota bacterium]
MFLVEDLYQKYKEALNLEIVVGEKGLQRQINIPEIHRACIFLTGFTSHYHDQRLLVFGQLEVEYLKTLSKELRYERIAAILTQRTPAVIVSHNHFHIEELLEVCSNLNITVFKIPDAATQAMSKILVVLSEEFSPIASRHGTFIEVYDVGVLIEGDSSVGKSETALGLIEKGHRLVSDDVVRIKKRKGSYLEGQGVELTRHHMEIRGIGIINVANIYGAYCVRDKKQIDIIIKLEEWNENHFYDRLGLEDSKSEILGIQVPYSLLPVKPGRDVVLLIETIALNFRLKKMGYHSAKDFRARQRSQIAQKFSQEQGTQ